MLIKKNSKGWFVRDVATEMYNKVGEWFKAYMPVVTLGLIVVGIATIMEVIL